MPFRKARRSADPTGAGKGQLPAPGQSAGHGHPPVAGQPGTDPGVSGPDPAGEVGLRTIVREWLRIGCIGFGGPPAHIALLRELCVTKRGWMSAEEFEDGISVTNLLPGPASTQLAIFCAWRLAGPVGALVGGACFIIPGLIVILGLSALFLAAHPPVAVAGAAAGAGAAVPAVAAAAAIGLVPASWRRARPGRGSRTGPRGRTGSRGRAGHPGRAGHRGRAGHPATATADLGACAVARLPDRGRPGGRAGRGFPCARPDRLRPDRDDHAPPARRRRAGRRLRAGRARRGRRRRRGRWLRRREAVPAGRAAAAAGGSPACFRSPSPRLPRPEDCSRWRGSRSRSAHCPTAAAS